MKSLFDSAAKSELIARIDTLKPGAVALWGKMNVNQCLRHLTMAFDIPNGKLNPTPGKMPPMPKWLLKFFVLNVKPPKGKTETFKEMNMVNEGINPIDFETEGTNLKRAIENFYNSTVLIPENKMAGKFSKDDWGKLSYNHTDHHLRQFGV